MMESSPSPERQQRRPQTARELLCSAPSGECLRLEGPDCTLYYREQRGQFVERAVFDDGRVGGVYTAGDMLDDIPAAKAELVPADAWPTRESVASSTPSKASETSKTSGLEGGSSDD